MAFRILATARSFSKSDGPHHAYLRGHDCEVDLRPPDHPYSEAELAALIPGYEGVILGLDDCGPSVIAAGDKLKVISRYGSGVETVAISSATQKGVVVTNTPGVNRVAVAELAVGLMFCVARSIPQVAHRVWRGKFERVRGWELSGKTLGILGLGKIGREVADRAVALGMRVLAYDPYVTSAPNAELASLEEVLAEAHIVTLHMPSTLDTRDFINVQRIAAMRDGAYLINTARGELVDEGALYDALKTGKLGGAASDVFRDEPPRGNPLLTLDNFIPTMHMAGTTRESVERMALLASQNLVAVLRGEPCDYIVNPEALGGGST
jgi:D-3-phosphoglycerate dehydrogenase